MRRTQSPLQTPSSLTCRRVVPPPAAPHHCALQSPLGMVPVASLCFPHSALVTGEAVQTPIPQLHGRGQAEKFCEEKAAPLCCRKGWCNESEQWGCSRSLSRRTVCRGLDSGVQPGRRTSDGLQEALISYKQRLLGQCGALRVSVSCEPRGT